MVRANAVFLSLAVLVSACSDGDDDAPVTEEPGAKTFAFRLRGFPATEEFRYSSKSQSFIDEARSQLALPEDQRFLFPIGTLAQGDGGHNAPWHWHLVDAGLTELAIELCDGTPSMVESDLAYWLDTVGNFCPWAGYVYAELP